MAPPAKVPSFMFGILIASVAYGEHIYTVNIAMLLLNTNALGIAITLFITSLGMIIQKKRATGKYNLPLVIPSVLIFILATVVRVALFETRINFLSSLECYGLMVQHVPGLCCQQEWSYGLPRANQNTSENGLSDWWNRSHNSDRCSRGMNFVHQYPGF